jgi:hypothetical protein
MSSRHGSLTRSCHLIVMHPASYYRERAEPTRSIAARVHRPDLLDVLHRVAQDYDKIAEDLEGGAIEIRHPDLMP